jgi:hypothetical protein
MPGDQFLHGIEVIEINEGIRPIRTVPSSIIGLIGTAPDADDTKFPYDTPILVAGNRREAAWLGEKGTLPYAMDGIFDHAGAMVIVVRVPDNERSGIVGHRGDGILANLRDRVGNSDGSLLGRLRDDNDGDSDRRSRNRIKSIRDRINERRSGRDRDGIIARLTHRLGSFWDQNGLGGSSQVSSQVISNIIGGVDPKTGKNLGVQCFLDAKSKTGLEPKILIAPGYTQEEAVVSEMLGIADRLRAVIIADGPNTNDEDAIKYRENFGSARVFIVDPWVTVWDTIADHETAEPASARVAGIIAKSDNERGFWWSPSNREFYGTTGTYRNIDFALGDYNSRANYLNSNDVATIIRQDGYRLWGNRTCSSDPRWAFLSVRRTGDMIAESIMTSSLWAIDRNITKTFVEEVTGSVNAYLRNLYSQGAILGGRCYANPELNTPDQLMQGIIYFDYDFTAPPPAEHIIFRAHNVDDYYSNIFVSDTVAVTGVNT